MMQVKLTWINNVVGETGIEVWRETVFGGPGTLYATVPADAVSYTDPTPPVGTVYYKIRAVSAVEQQPFTDFITLHVPSMTGTLSGFTGSVIP
jgi:hypothetical protein